MPIRFGFVAIGCALLCVSSSRAHARTSEPEANEVPEYSTTVRARPTPESASEHVIDGDVIQATAKADAGEALRLVPGLVVSRHGGEGKAQQLFLRGFDAIHGQDLELWVGGAPVNAVSHIHALGYADLGFVVPEVIDSITAFEGPYRADQGDFAVAGSVRLSLAAPGSGAFGAASVGQFGRRRVVAGLGGDDPRSFAVVELAQGEGYGPARAFARFNLLTQARRRLGDLELRGLAGAHATRFASPGVLATRDLEGGRVDFFDTYDPHQGGASERLHLLLEAASPDDDTAATVYLVRQTLKLKHNFTGFWFDPRGDGLEQLNDATTVGLTLRTTRRARAFGRPMKLQLGAGARHDLIDQSQRGYRDADGVAFEDSARASRLSIAQTHVHAFARTLTRFHRWQLTLGVRADALATGVEQRNALGARAGLEAGLARRIGDHTRLILQYGDGFRSPHAASLADGERTPFISVRGAEVGMRHDTRRLAASLAVFSSWVGNDLFFDHTTSTTSLIGETLRAGVTGALAIEPLSNLRLQASGTVAHAVALESGTRLPGFIPYVGRLDATWRRGLPHDLSLDAGVSLTAIGPRPLRFGDLGPGYVLGDLSLTLAWRRVGLRLDVSNLLDARWTDGEFTYPSRFHDDADASSLPARHFTAGAPRTVSLSLVIHPRSTR